MTTTPIADMVEQMFAANAAPNLIVLAIRAVETVSSHVRGLSAETSADKADARLAKDRERKRLKREKDKKIKAEAEANDAAQTAAIPPGNVRGQSADSAEICCDLLTSLSSSVRGIQEEGKKVRHKTRARGTRMSADSPLSEEALRFALDNGLSEIRTRAL